MVTVLQIKQMVSQAYFGDAVMTETDYSRGRKLFIAEGCCANGVVTLTTGAFLSGYAGYLGADDSLNGIIGSIPVLLCTLQMFSSVVLENLRQKKFLIACFALIHRLLLSSVFFVPLVVEDNAGRLAAVVAIYVVAHFFGAFIGTGTGSWLLSLVPENIRGTYLGRKDAFAFAFTTVLSLLCGRILDWMRGAHQDLLGYYIIGLIVLSTAFTDFWCLSSIREPVQETHRRSLKAAVIDPLLDREYRKVIGLYMFWNLALQVAGPFFSVYMVTGLSLDYTYITFLADRFLRPCRGGLFLGTSGRRHLLASRGALLHAPAGPCTYVVAVYDTGHLPDFTAHTSGSLRGRVGRNRHRGFQPSVPVRPSRQAGHVRQRQLLLRRLMRILRHAAWRVPVKDPSGVFSRGV